MTLKEYIKMLQEYDKQGYGDAIIAVEYEANTLSVMPEPSEDGKILLIYH